MPSPKTLPNSPLGQSRNCLLSHSLYTRPALELCPALREEEGLGLLHSWTPQCSKGTVRAHVLGLTNELCSEVKLSLRFALERKEVNLHISIQHTLCSPLWSRLHAWVLGTLVWISEVGGTGRLAALGFGSEVAVRTAPFEPPAPTNPFFAFFGSCILDHKAC